MRLALLSPILVVAACGGGQKAADAPSADTSSLESGGSAAPKASASASDAAPDHGAEEPEAPAHPTPAVTGAIDGKPFTPKLARVTSKVQKDGRLMLSIDDSTDCTDSPDATLTVVVPWQDGYKVDLGALKRGSKKGPGEIAFARAGAAGKKEFVKAFKPSGTVTIVKAPNTENAVGKMKIDMQSGDYMLAGDLDIQVCVAPK